ncbi:hypothetical protein [Paenibacillus terrigena]|uniref:hypothetical protein n=1 Tax=Paenibacillus terrigena TaxID=369333 RepID=UPI0028D5F5BB|nr:hypothetical protein [Paenibacillus terrigena]
MNRAVIAEPKYESFIPYTAIAEMFVHLVIGAEDQVLEAMADTIEQEILTAKPFLREIGGYKVVKGLWNLRRQAWREAEQLLDKGSRFWTDPDLCRYGYSP